MQLYLSALILALALSAMGLGIFLSMRIFNIPDITTDGSYTMGAAISTIAIIGGLHPLPAIILSMLGGAVAGTCTGLITTKLRINPLLAGILVSTALYSVNLSMMGRPNIPLVSTRSIYNIIPFAGDGYISLLLAGSLALTLLLFWLLRTDFGIAMRATGSSESMSRAMGVNTNRMKVIGLALANSLTALSGSLVSQYQGFADINMGIGIVILGLGAVMIGEALATLLKTNNILVQLSSVLIGSIVFRMILAYTLSLGLNPNLLKLVTAVFVLISISAPKMLNKGRKTAFKL